MDHHRGNHRVNLRETLTPNIRSVYSELPADMRSPVQYHTDSVFQCGDCSAQYHMIWQLHEHIQLHSLGGSYTYDHCTQTAFPKYSSVSKETQTANEYSNSVALVCIATQTEDSLEHFFDARDNMTEAEQADSKLSGDNVQVKHEDMENGFHVKGDKPDGSSSEADVQDAATMDQYSGETDEEWVPELESRIEKVPKGKKNDSNKIPEKVSKTKGARNNRLRTLQKQSSKKRRSKSLTERKKLKTTKEHQNSLKKEPVKCNFCEEVFQNTLHRKRHSVLAHPDEKNHTCSRCTEAFVTESELQKHRKVHQREKFRCPTCKKCLSSPQNLQDHMTMHTGEKTYECKDCGIFFRSRSQLTLHASRKHNPNYDQMCDNCGRTFKCRQNLKGHIRYCLDIKPFICKVCGKRFPRNTNLNVHMRKHTGEKPFVCHTCGMKFMHSNTLTKHMLVHTGERKFPCEICGMKFKAHNALKDHQRIHNQDKRFTCQYCGKGFIKKCNMVTHIRQHTGETPYKCQICGQGYKQNVLLRTHMQSHRNEMALTSGLQNDSSSSSQFQQQDSQTAHHSASITRESPSPSQLPPVSDQAMTTVIRHSPNSSHPGSHLPVHMTLPNKPSVQVNAQPAHQQPGPSLHSSGAAHHQVQSSHQQHPGFAGILRPSLIPNEGMSHALYQQPEQQHSNLHSAEDLSTEQRNLRENVADYMLARM